jgi:hypothetical protein
MVVKHCINHVLNYQSMFIICIFVEKLIANKMLSEKKLRIK